VRGIVYRFDSFETLAQHLDSGNEAEDIDLACCEGLRDGEWLLVTFGVGADATSLAGRVEDSGETLKLRFEHRDWEQLKRFARGDGPPSVPPENVQSRPTSIHAPPDSKVLVIDDDPGVQNVLCCLLRASGFDVAAVGSAEEALDRLRQVRADVLVLDWNLPGMSGIEFCRRLRKDRALGCTPVLFLTANSSSRDVVEAFEAGADDYVTKPFRAPELGARLFGLLRRSRLPLVV
jgi:two-component system phosphate regulon response regulator PhoB